MSGEKYCYWKEEKAQRKWFSYQRQCLSGEWALVPERKTWMPWDRKGTKSKVLMWQRLTVFNLCYLCFIQLRFILKSPEFLFCENLCLLSHSAFFSKLHALVILCLFFGFTSGIASNDISWQIQKIAKGEDPPGLWPREITTERSR